MPLIAARARQTYLSDVGDQIGFPKYSSYTLRTVPVAGYVGEEAAWGGKRTLDERGSGVLTELLRFRGTSNHMLIVHSQRPNHGAIFVRKPREVRILCH